MEYRWDDTQMFAMLSGPRLSDLDKRMDEFEIHKYLRKPSPG